MLDVVRDRSPGEPMISIRGLSRHYGAVCALDDVTLDIGAGEFFSLLGPSGCGKTTLLRMLAGFDRPSSGDIFIGGQRFSDVPPHKRPVRMVFQNYAIFPHLNVGDNILYGLRRQKLARGEADRVVAEALELVKLPGLDSRRPDQLSGGQRQRVALARALVCKPKVLLLDEPLGALDKKLREEMQVELRRLQRLVGITFVFVTHDQEEALAMSDRVAVMARGRTLQIDTPVRLYEAPRCRAVAGFIGSMNLVEVRFEKVEEKLAELRFGEEGSLRASRFPSTLRREDVVTAGFRPETVQLNLAPRTGPNTAAGIVQATSYLGDRTHFIVQVEGLGSIVVARQNTGQATVAVEPGRKVWIELPPHLIHVFAPDEQNASKPTSPTSKERVNHELEAAPS